MQEHGCGIALSAKARPAKIRKAVQNILSEKAFKEVAISFQENIHTRNKGGLIIRELDDLVGLKNKKSVILEDQITRSA